jgi:hypothetical protein
VVGVVVLVEELEQLSGQVCLCLQVLLIQLLLVQVALQSVQQSVACLALIAQLHMFLQEVQLHYSKL